MRCKSSLTLALSSVETILPSYLLPIQVSAATTETAASDPSAGTKKIFILLLFSVYTSDTTLGTALF